MEAISLFGGFPTVSRLLFITWLPTPPSRVSTVANRGGRPYLSLPHHSRGVVEVHDAGGTCDGALTPAQAAPPHVAGGDFVRSCRSTQVDRCPRCILRSSASYDSPIHASSGKRGRRLLISPALRLPHLFLPSSRRPSPFPRTPSLLSRPRAPPITASLARTTLLQLLAHDSAVPATVARAATRHGPTRAGCLRLHALRAVAD